MRLIRRMERHMPAWLWDNLVTISILGLLVVLSLFGFAVVNLNQSNRDRINDIQSSRVASCERTYEGIREVFKPFLPAPGTGSAKQQRDIRKFNATIDRLKKRCTVQTKPKGTA